MSTVGRIACSFALTKVLTRSRGTPAAALARYCRRKVLVAIQLVATMVTRRPRGRQSNRQKAKGFWPSAFRVEQPLSGSVREVRPRPRRCPDVLVDAAGKRCVQCAGTPHWRAEIHV